MVYLPQASWNTDANVESRPGKSSVFSQKDFQSPPTPLEEDASLLYRRLSRIVTGEDVNSAFQKISVSTKQAIIEILFKRKSYVPIYYQL
jgi:hypothetical protein